MEEIHIGNAIADELKKQRLSKSDFAHLMGIQQQNVNRILENKSISTDKLQKISDVLHYNFFTLFTDTPSDINVVASGDSSIAALNSKVLTTDTSLLQQRVLYLEKLIAEKERLIQYLIKDEANDNQK